MPNSSTSPIANLFPGYFALVMATGIVAIAAYFLGMEMIGYALLAINCAAYIVLWALTAARLWLYRTNLLNDLTHHQRSVLFLTIVAGN